MPIMRLLISAHANLNLTNADGRTALIVGVLHNREDVVAELLDFRAVSRIKDIGGMTALDHAHQRQYFPIVELLSQARANSPSHSTRSSRTSVGHMLPRATSSASISSTHQYMSAAPPASHQDMINRPSELEGPGFDDTMTFESDMYNRHPPPEARTAAAPTRATWAAPANPHQSVPADQSQKESLQHQAFQQRRTQNQPAPAPLMVKDISSEDEDWDKEMEEEVNGNPQLDASVDEDWYVDMIFFFFLFVFFFDFDCLCLYSHLQCHHHY